MMLFLVEWLSLEFNLRVPAAFTYTSSRMMMAAITALLLSIFLGPHFIKKLYEWKIGQTIRTDECPLLGQLHHKKQDTPTMGGILILFAMLASLILWMDLTHIFTWILLSTTLVLGGLGAWDDYRKLKFRNTKGISARGKLLIQFLFASVVAAYLFFPGLNEGIEQWLGIKSPVIKEHVPESATTPSGAAMQALSMSEYAGRLYFPFFKEPILVFTGFGVVVAILFTTIVIAGSTNAVNLTDGLDGLATGCLIMVAGCLAVFAFLSNHLDFARYLNILYIEGSGEVAIYLSALIGACLGFLWYNCFPAQVFMGDTGSLAMGGVIGVSAVLLKREFLLALVGGIFVAEVLSDIIQIGSYRYRNKKRVFLCAPLHHHFEFKGWPETKVVTRFWIVGLLLALVGLVSLKFQ